MKQKFLKDIGIDIEDETKDLLNQFAKKNKSGIIQS